MALQYGTGGGLDVQMEGPYAVIYIEKEVEGGTSMKLTEVKLAAADWKGGESPYSQVVEMDTVTVNSQVDLQPSVEQMEEFLALGLSLTTVNNNGTVTIYAIGEKPTADYTIQATVTEVIT